MNFTEFSFWWVLFSIGAPVLGLRAGLLAFRMWPEGGDRTILLFMSLVLFWNAAPSSFLIFAAELCINYAALRLMVRQHDWRRYGIATFIIVLDVSILAYFKYLDFLFNDFLAALIPGLGSEARPEILQGVAGIPPGISFYTFQMIACMLDSVREKDTRVPKLIDYFNFAAFFPQIVAGPIERRSDLMPQIENFRLRFTVENMDSGMRWLALGLFMKLVLADNLSIFIDWKEAANPFIVGLSVYIFGLRIYFDFAGYSFIALGLARMLGIQLTVNFQSPYISRNIQEFWRRWHVSLSTWFRDYVFIPLGGSRVAFASVNILIVFVISGLWHGAGWNFVLWGAYHGLLLILYSHFGRRFRLPSGAAWLVTFVVCMFSWIFFMETDMARLGAKLLTLANPGGYTLSNLHAMLGGFDRVNLGIFAVSFMMAHMVLIAEHFAVRIDRADPLRYLNLRPVAHICLAMTFVFSTDIPSPFVYFAF